MVKCKKCKTACKIELNKNLIGKKKNLQKRHGVSQNNERDAADQYSARTLTSIKRSEKKFDEPITIQKQDSEIRYLP